MTAPETSNDSRFSWAIGPLFLGVAAWCLFGPSLDAAPDLPPAAEPTAARTRDALRIPLGDPPTTRIGPYDQSCQQCHMLRETIDEPGRTLTQHQGLVLDHGLNDRCLNCHHGPDRNQLVLAGGDPLPFADSARLCAQCHGTLYRDWQRGVHGRTTGSWRHDDPRFRRLTCVECHDPHAPAFAPMNAWPGPHTLRTDPAHAPAHDPFGHGHHPLAPLRRDVDPQGKDAP